MNCTLNSLIQFVNNPGDVLASIFSEYAKRDFEFMLCLGATETSDVEGISAAGATAVLRRLTAAVDAEALLTGKTFSAGKLPVSPIGIVSPVVITRACLQRMNIDARVVDCGTFIAPKSIHHEAVGSGPSKCVSTGNAMSLDAVHALFQSGLRAGRQTALEGKAIVLAECVPGGTTTALAVLAALGRDVRQSLSSSLPQCNHDARWSLAQQGLDIARRSGRLNSALSIIAAVGDPMQPYAAGIVLGAQGVRDQGPMAEMASPAPRVPIILAGGSQMLAVYDLVTAISREQNLLFDRRTTAVVTTKWVAFDTGAKLLDLSAEIGAPFAAACPDFTQSCHPGLRAYEQGNVKEGVGAGAAMLLWSLRYGAKGLMEAIDQGYVDLTSAG